MSIKLSIKLFNQFHSAQVKLNSSKLRRPYSQLACTLVADIFRPVFPAARVLRVVNESVSWAAVQPPCKIRLMAVNRGLCPNTLYIVYTVHCTLYTVHCSPLVPSFGPERDSGWVIWRPVSCKHCTVQLPCTVVQSRDVQLVHCSEVQCSGVQ